MKPFVIYTLNIILSIISFILSFITRLYFDNYFGEFSYNLIYYKKIFIISLILWIIITLFTNLHKKFDNYQTYLRTVFVTVFFHILFLSAFFFFYREHSYSRLWLLLFWGYETLLLIIVKVISRSIKFKKRSAKFVNQRSKFLKKEKIKKSYRRIQIFLIGIDSFFIALGYSLIYYFRFNTTIFSITQKVPVWTEQIYKLWFIVGIWVIVLYLIKLYNIKRIRKRIQMMLKTYIASIIVMFLFVWLTYISKTRYKQEWGAIIFSGLAIIPVFLILNRIILSYYIDYLINITQENILIIGTGETAEFIYNKLKEHLSPSKKISGFIKVNQNDNIFVENNKILGLIDDIETEIVVNKISKVIVAVSNISRVKLQEVMRICESRMVDFRIFPAIVDIMLTSIEIEEVGGLPTLGIKTTPLNTLGNKIIKRIFDIGFSLFVIIFLSPFLFFIILLVKLTSRGPSLYKQIRISKNNKEFNILKFRSMRVDAEKNTGAVYASADDNRRTSIGTIMRKLSIDELPQFFNVLKGDMSIVGPRPERPEFVKKYQNEISQYMLRHKVKAGITGWAQVNGLRGRTSIEERVKFDLWYIENWSLVLDIKIILMTFLEMFFGFSAY